MKIRYYLRGLGLGILFTSVFFLISNSDTSHSMSDAEIMARAKELGMTESTVLADISEKVTEEETSAEETTVEEVTVEETITEETTTEDTNIEETTVEETTAEDVTAEESMETPIEEETVIPEASEVSQEAESTERISIMVNRGEGSDTVSHKLQQAGLVADAYEYDRYLMANGYDKRIGAGEHSIPVGATWEEIADVLCH